MNLVVPDIAQCLTIVLNIEYSKIARRKLEGELGRKKKVLQFIDIPQLNLKSITPTYLRTTELGEYPFLGSNRKKLLHCFPYGSEIIPNEKNTLFFLTQHILRIADVKFWHICNKLTKQKFKIHYLNQIEDWRKIKCNINDNHIFFKIGCTFLKNTVIPYGLANPSERIAAYFDVAYFLVLLLKQTKKNVLRYFTP